MEPILIPTEKGIYCPMGDFYIDPLRPVDRAVITHGHADHARTGHGHVLATPETLGIMEARYGKKHATHVQPLELGGKLDHFGVAISMHPAGHILGSAQVAVEAQGQKNRCSGGF
jgi:Predicted exonuclease of the beta-lactamase fold involved in RNA processing